MRVSDDLKLPCSIEALGLAATLSPWIMFNSSSRIQMLSSHKGQELVVKKPDLPKAIPGFESQLAEHSFNVVMPVNGNVVGVYYKYRTVATVNGNRQNPIITVVFRRQDTGEYDFIEIPRFKSNHKVFGFEYIHSPIVKQLRKGFPIEEGTVLARSPSIDENFMYGGGVNANVAYVSASAVIEDGFEVSDEFLDKMSPLEMSSEVLSFGRKRYPLNIHGDKDNYKVFPDIGEKIPDTGLLFATRDYNDRYNVVEMLPKNLRKVDMITDQRVYSSIPGAEIYDITAYSGVNEVRTVEVMDPKMSLQTRHYIENVRQYHEGLRELDKQIFKEHNSSMTPALQRLIVDSLGFDPNDKRNFVGGKSVGLVRRDYKKVPIDEYRVEVFFQKRKKLGLGSKLTDLFGGKGVVCKITPKHLMPLAADGTRVDVMAFVKGAVSRLNPGQFYEQFYSASMSTVERKLRDGYGKVPNSELWDYLMSYYKAAAPENYEICMEVHTTPELQDQHIKHIVENELHLVISPVSPHHGIQAYFDIMKVAPPTYAPLKLFYRDGREIYSRDPILVGKKHMIVLEKSDQKPMAVSSAVLQHHGLISSSSPNSRTANPSKIHATRVLGETEVRLLSASIGTDVVANLLDLANNPVAHRASIRNMYHSKHPAKLPHMVSRAEVPYGGSRAIGFTRHVLGTMGSEIIDHAE